MEINEIEKQLSVLSSEASHYDSEIKRLERLRQESYHTIMFLNQKRHEHYYGLLNTMEEKWRYFFRKNTYKYRSGMKFVRERVAFMEEFFPMMDKCFEMNGEDSGNKYFTPLIEWETDEEKAKLTFNNYLSSIVNDGTVWELYIDFDSREGQLVTLHVITGDTQMFDVTVEVSNDIDDDPKVITQEQNVKAKEILDIIAKYK
mgnify:CR=1 FL=1